MDGPVAVYRFFDADARLLYVGLTSNPGKRTQQHRYTKPWWCEVSTMTVETHEDAREGARAERWAIQTEDPKYNVAHHPTRGTVAPRVVVTSESGRVVGSAEIASMLGVCRQRVQQLTVNKGFPALAARLRLGRLWRTSDVVRWAESRGREVHE